MEKYKHYIVTEQITELKAEHQLDHLEIPARHSLDKDEVVQLVDDYYLTKNGKRAKVPTDKQVYILLRKKGTKLALYSDKINLLKKVK